MWLVRELSVKWAGSGSAGWRKLWLSDRGENAAHFLLVSHEDGVAYVEDAGDVLLEGQNKEDENFQNLKLSEIWRDV